MGYEAVKHLVAHLNGEEIETRVKTGEYVATPANMDEPRIKELLYPEQLD